MAVIDHTTRTAPAGWTAATAADEDGRPLQILLTADAVGGEERPRAILARPRALRRGPGERVLAVTLVLTRAPRVGEALEPLLDRAVLALDAETLPPEGAAAGLGASALVSQGTTLTLLGAGERTLATIALNGPGRAAGLQATLDGPDAAAVLAAVEGHASDISCRAELRFRTAAPAAGGARLRFDLQRVHDRLDVVADDARRFFRADLRHYLGQMLDEGVVDAEPSAPAVSDALLTAFLRGAAPLLRRLPDPPDPELGEVLELGPRPSATSTVSATVAGTGVAAAGAAAAVTIEATLEELLGDVRAAAGLERAVSIVAPGDGGLAPVPLPAPRRRAAPPGATPVFVGDGERVLAQSAAVRASAAAAPSAHAVLAAGAVQVFHARPELFAAADDLVAVVAPPAGPAGPVVADAGAALWPDRNDEGRLWYAPAYALVPPVAATATPDVSPFLFRFRTVGHAADGRPFLEATVRLTAERRMPDATRTDWEARGKPDLQPVPAEGLSFELHVPYIDEATGETRVQPVPAARVTEHGDRVQVEFDLLDRWARLAYGALAKPGFQARTAALSIAYNFIGWRRIGLPDVLGPEILEVPALERMRGAPDDVAGRIRFPAGTLELRRPAGTELRPEIDVDIPPIRPHVGRRPPFGGVPRPRWLRRTHAHVDGLEVLVPCATFGGLYVEEEEGELHAGRLPGRLRARPGAAARLRGRRADLRAGRHARPAQPDHAGRASCSARPLPRRPLRGNGGRPRLQADDDVAQHRRHRNAGEHQVRRRRRPAARPVAGRSAPRSSASCATAPPGAGRRPRERAARRGEHRVGAAAVGAGLDGDGLDLAHDGGLRGQPDHRPDRRAGAAADPRGDRGPRLGDDRARRRPGRHQRPAHRARPDRRPALDGPVTVTIAGTTATLRNAIESPVAVDDLLAGAGATPVPVDAELAPAPRST